MWPTKCGPWWVAGSTCIYVPWKPPVVRSQMILAYFCIFLFHFFNHVSWTSFNHQFFYLSGWPDWLWRVCCHDATRRCWDRTTNHASDFEHEGLTGNPLSFPIVIACTGWFCPFSALLLNSFLYTRRNETSVDVNTNRKKSLLQNTIKLDDDWIWKSIKPHLNVTFNLSLPPFSSIESLIKKITCTLW